jgi:peptidoglycan/xylan/chitin deacetylase (PgdA/CDA1 family)
MFGWGPLAFDAVRRSALISTVAALLLAPALAGCGGSGSSSTASSAARARHATRRSEASHKKTFRRTVAVLAPPAGAPVRTVHVPVLTYHRVHTMPAVGQLDLIVDPANFAAELKALHDGGYQTVSQTQLFRALYEGKALPPKPVLISVDDGYVDDVRTILPDLERWHMVATFFVITGRMTEPGFLTASQIRELDRAGMDVGDHTAHHVDLRLLTPSQLQAETAGSRKTLEAVLGHPVYFFAYPFGYFNDQVVQAVRDAGFTMAYTTQGGTTESTASPLEMPRIHVGRSEDPAGLLSILGGA